MKYWREEILYVSQLSLEDEFVHRMIMQVAQTIKVNSVQFKHEMENAILRNRLCDTIRMVSIRNSICYTIRMVSLRNGICDNTPGIVFVELSAIGT